MDVFDLQCTSGRVLRPCFFPAADTNLLKVPSNLSDEQVLFLSDIYPTAWHANELGQVGEGDKVAIWGCWPRFVYLLNRPLSHRSLTCEASCHNNVQGLVIWSKRAQFLCMR